MKKLLIICAVLCIAQITFAQPRYGIRGGLNISNVKLKATYQGQSFSQSGDAIPTFHIGGMADFPLSEHFSVQPSLLLNGMGSDLSDGTTTVKFRPFYLQLPVLLVAKTELPNTSLSIYGGVGPSFGYGLFGKAKAQGMSEDVFSSDGFKRFDFGVDLTLGVELPSGLQLGLHFVPGLADVGPDDDPLDPDFSSSIKNTLFSFSIGYFLSQKSK